MKRIISMILLAAVTMSSLQGCYGKMALTRKVYSVNGQVQNKFLRSLVTWAFIIVPVYGVSALVDFLLFNTIEFWSGQNPVASGEKNFQYAEDGQTYQVTARKSGDQLTYVINHDGGNGRLDTLTINWDVKSGNSSAMLAEPGKMTAFNAVKEGRGVTVTSSDQLLSSRPERVAYR